MKIRNLFLVIPLVALSSFANAGTCSQTQNTLDKLVGLDSSSGLIYANVSSSINQCSCSAVRFKPVNTDVNMALSILLSAKMAEKKVRVDLLDESDCNSAYRVYVE